MAVKINRIIARNRSTQLADANNKDNKQLWALLRKTGNWGVNKQSVYNIDVNVINDFFANIATDPNYSRSDVIHTALQTPRRPHNFVKRNATPCISPYAIVMCVCVCLCVCVFRCMPRLWTSGKRFETETPFFF